MINNMMADALFGSSNSYGGGSFLSASNFGDLSLIKSGVYKKMLRSYSEKVVGDSSDSGSKDKYVFKNSVSEKMEQLSKPKSTTENADNKALSTIKSDSNNLEKAANELMGKDFDASTRDELYTAAKSFVTSYNSLLTSSAKTDNVSLSKSVTWMKNDVKAHEKMLGKIGITIGKDGALSIDEEKFKSAKLSDIRTEMSGSASIVGKTAQRATGLYNLAANQISTNIGNSLYTSSGIYK